MMKKSQILAAIALAMALGVVAPVVSVSAAATPAGTEAAKLVDSEVAKMKAEFGTVTTYNADGSTSIDNDGYTYYNKVDGELTNIETQLKLIDKAGMDSLMGATALGTVDAAPFSNYLSADTLAKVRNSNGEIKTYAEAKALAATVVAELSAKTEASVGTTIYNQLQAKIAAIKDTPNTNYLAAAETAVEGAAAAHKNDAAVTALRNEVKALTGVMPDAPETLAEYSSIISTVSNKFPKMAAFRRVKAELAKSHLDDLVTTNYNDRQIKELIANMWAAYNGTTITTPSDQIVNEANGVNAPATGIAGTAEGTATTVSIVAGLATALTALGAGVVAYRSARRK